jgi:diaminopimelate epimerase
MDQGIEFVKGHGTGNDFVLLPDPTGGLELTPSRVRALCDRHCGLGADGVLRVVPGALVPDAPQDTAEGWFMDYRNADGSVAEMCGNGVRVFARYLAAAGLVSEPEFRVGSRSGARAVRLHADGSVAAARMTVPIMPRYDALLVNTAMTQWKYKPATRVGVAVPYTMRVRIVVQRR